MDPNISKATTGKERVVTACAESQSTSRVPNRTRFLTVQSAIRSKMQGDKKTLLAEEDTSKKRNLTLVGGYADNAVDLCGEGIFCVSPHPPSVSAMYTQTHRDTGIKSAAFAMDKQFCRREMDDGVKKDIWSVMEDF